MAGEDLVAKRLQASTGFLLARIGMESRRIWSRMLDEHQLTAGHYGMLMALDLAGATSQQRASKIVGLDPRNAVPLVDALSARGLVERRPDPADRRRHALVLTKKGKALIGLLHREGASLERAMLEDLSGSERAGLHRVLLKLFVRIAT